MLWPTHLHDPLPEGLEHRLMESESPLQGQDANGGAIGHQPRSASLRSRSSMPIPVIGAPRPRLTFARMWGSM